MLLIEIIPGLSWLHRIMILTRPRVAGTNIVITTARLARLRVAITYYPKYEYEYC